MDFRYAFVFALLALMPLSSAALSDAVKGQGLASAMDDVMCKNTFMIAVMDSISSAIPGSDFGAQVGILSADGSKLQTYADSSDVEGFKAYIKGTYDPDLKSAREAVVDWRKSAKNVSKDTRESLRGSYSSLKSTYDSCHMSAIKAHAEAKISWYKGILDNAEGKAKSLSAKGVDTSGLSSLIAEARSKVVSPLESEVGSASDAKGMHAALQAHCLFNGCGNGVNDHFAAKFEVEKLNRILDKIEASPKSANATTQITTAQNDLSSASSMISSMGDSAGSSAQYEQLWSAIKDAASSMKEAVAAMRSG